MVCLRRSPDFRRTFLDFVSFLPTVAALRPTLAGTFTVPGPVPLTPPMVETILPSEVLLFSFYACAKAAFFTLGILVVPYLAFFDMFLELVLVPTSGKFGVVRECCYLILSFFIRVMPICFNFSTISIGGFAISSGAFRGAFKTSISSTFILRFGGGVLIRGG